jgi:hypothetical protein
MRLGGIVEATLNTFGEFIELVFSRPACVSSGYVTILEHCRGQTVLDGDSFWGNDMVFGSTSSLDAVDGRSDRCDRLTDTVVTRKKHTMVTTGPYAWVRHPFYTSVALAIVANSLATANWFVFTTGCLAVTLLVMRCRTEEENLIERFGDEYRAYARRTGRFVPRFSERRRS